MIFTIYEDFGNSKNVSNNHLKIPQFKKRTVKDRLKPEKINCDIEVGEGATRNSSNTKITNIT